MDERGIEFIPHGRGQKYYIENTDVLIRHSPFSYSKHCAMANLDKKKVSILFGCTHRKQKVVIRDGEDNEMVGVSNGCMLDRDSAICKYMDTDDWSQGFSLFYVNEENYFIKEVEIKEGEAVFNNVHYIGRDDFEF